MLADLDETLRQLLIQKGGIKPAQVDIDFDMPTRDWSASRTNRPTVNLSLYHVRENRELRQTEWYEEVGTDGRATLRRSPLRLDIDYMITCWTGAAEDQHRLFWRVLETFFRHSPLPDEMLQGRLRQLVHPVRTEVAQGDGVLKNLADYWGALENGLRPGASLTATLELDLEQIRGQEPVPLVFSPALRLKHLAATRNGEAMTRSVVGAPGETELLRVAGIVHDAQGRPMPGFEVRLMTVMDDGAQVQIGSTVYTQRIGGYTIAGIPPGNYMLVVGAPESPLRRLPIQLMAQTSGQVLPPFVHHIEVAAHGNTDR